jgi:polyhydroxyalkanoate synthesis regulator phasin
VDEEINHRVRSLISRGELSEEEGGSLLQKLLSQGKEMAAGALPHEEDVERVLSKRGIPTSSDLERISAQLDELAEKLDRLQQE